MPSLSVRTFDSASFQAACTDLMHAVESSYEPTMIVGIRTGGLVVAEAMARSAGRPVEVAPLTCRRAATRTKARFLGTMLARLPRRVADALRLLELELVSTRRRAAPPQPVDQAEATAIGKRAGGERLLVVDDAVDSGLTLATVLQSLRSVCPEGTAIRSAAITVTLDRPIAFPDYALFQRVVCRFPWSFDAAR